MDDVVHRATRHELGDDVPVAVVHEDAHEQDHVRVGQLAHHLHLSEELGQALLAVVEELLDGHGGAAPVALPHLRAGPKAKAGALLDLRNVDPRDGGVLLQQACDQLLVAHFLVVDLYRGPVAAGGDAPGAV